MQFLVEAGCYLVLHFLAAIGSRNCMAQAGEGSERSKGLRRVDRKPRSVHPLHQEKCKYGMHVSSYDPWR